MAMHPSLPPLKKLRGGGGLVSVAAVKEEEGEILGGCPCTSFYPLFRVLLLEAEFLPHPAVPDELGGH